MTIIRYPEAKVRIGEPIVNEVDNSLRVTDLSVGQQNSIIITQLKLIVRSLAPLQEDDESVTENELK